MPEPTSFTEFLRRIRAGDQQAAAELVRRYEPLIRRVVRQRLEDQRLCRLFDSMDVCQSVLASFFVRAALGQYELRNPDDLLKLLATMARNKVVDRTRRADVDRRVPEEALPEEAQVAPGASPSQQVALHDLVEEARRRLSPDERRVLELRQQGLEWAEVAAQVGGSPEALRKRFTRAVEQVAEQMRLDER